MKIQKIIKNVDIVQITNSKNLDISLLSFDSRESQKNSMFFAIKGTSTDGSEYIESAIKKGAKVIVHSSKIIKKNENVIYIKVKDVKLALAICASNFYDHPSKKLKLVGVTGTNGKTTTATLLYKLFTSLGYKSALISTIENKINSRTYKTTHTTPDPIAINKLLDLALKNKCKFAFMECSSHAIDQKRIYGLNFVGGIFTNLTQDHLDYHKTISKYAETKKKFFDILSPKAFALGNADDSKFRLMIKNTKAKKYSFSLENRNADFFGKILDKSLAGSVIRINARTIKTKLIGNFNVYNIVGIYATAKLLGLPESKIESAISRLEPPKGRLEFVRSKNGKCAVVDYSHTPDALKKALETIREITAENKIITVVGCGGDRDKSKRPIMGSIACTLSDFSIFTSDNPRTENPDKIIKDMLHNLKKTDKYTCITDREKATKFACEYAQKGDVILVAGKGHENYQIFKDKTISYSDVNVLKKYINK